jgi:hypothetical protein
VSVEITQKMLDHAVLAVLNADRETMGQPPLDTLDGLLSLDLRRYSAMRDDALAALEAAAPMIQDASVEEVAVLVDRIADRHWKPVQVFRSDTEVEHDDIRRDTATDIAAAIRATKGAAQ